jgi:selenocysteine lyase/cysteine desulfurase
VVTIPECERGGIDLAALKQALIQYQDRPLKIGSFSAASNVTGVLTNTYDIAITLHEYDAWAFFDFAAAAPYVDIEMHPPHEKGDLAAKDAIFISPHKLIGGPQTPGVLVAKKSLFQNRVPAKPGGGTVFFVSPSHHDYLDDISHREEGGTPAIIESIRAGLVFQLKMEVGVETIHRQEASFTRRALERWSAHPHIQILGRLDVPRLSIISFNIRHQKMLHHNFVVRLLNDLFGIQARGGCSCAGPYGHHLLGIGHEKSEQYYCTVRTNGEGVKPGWVRVNFNYFISEDGFNFILKAVEFIATHGFKFLPVYEFDLRSGLWTHCDLQTGKPFSLMDDVAYEEGRLQYRSTRATCLEGDCKVYLQQAEELAGFTWKNRQRYQWNRVDLAEDLAPLIWFDLPQDILKEDE